MIEEYSGRYGHAERIPTESLTYLAPAQEACLGAYLITAPGQHILYTQFQLSVCHLRPIEGVPPARLQRPGMTHELLLHGLDPSRNPSKHDIQTLVPMLPINASVQFSGTDEDATRLLQGGVRAICDGFLPAEGGSEAQCQRIWEASIAETLEHMRTGGHAHG